ncbi:flagellar export protein FliJ [Roseateles violae]|uniref:Flagellar export protein FliJ n=1 Tax=Roseateles violae TaxID=3058042 RepID=A0ABT8DWT2_9BURK|nr:flagellar export protein FliJ [Pelomonas sp. PFR6]MDN3921570.1 flagellar export protein FliJ [Pelomonas sp. PFR6]
MKNPAKQLQKNLGTLIELRTRELERRQAELARQQALCARVEKTIERLDQLHQGASAGGGEPLSLGLAQNCVAYKQAVRQMAEGQRRELLQKQAEMGECRAAVKQVALQQQVLGQVLAQSQVRLSSAEQRQQQKQQDDLGAQMWLRGQRA